MVIQGFSSSHYAVRCRPIWPIQNLGGHLDHGAYRGICRFEVSRKGDEITIETYSAIRRSNLETFMNHRIVHDEVTRAITQTCARRNLRVVPRQASIAFRTPSPDGLHDFYEGKFVWQIDHALDAYRDVILAFPALTNVSVSYFLEWD
jgi:hypothetical protein